MLNKPLNIEAFLEDERVAQEARQEKNSWLDRPVVSFVAFNWESMAWVAILLVTIATRFYDLGARAMSHDESLHTIYSYYLYDHGDYKHNPMMHGPLKFHLNALMYMLFGHNDYTSRIVPAVLGSLMVWIALLYRRYIGRSGALIAGILICVSPSLLFHSRYIRDDIYIEFCAMLWAYAAFRYLEVRQMRWLYVMTAAMAFGFVGMEANFITGAIFGAFFIGLLLWPGLQLRLLAVIVPLIPAGVGWFWLHTKARELSQQATPLETSDATEFQRLMTSSESYDFWSYLLLGVGVLLTVGLLLWMMRRKDWLRLRVAPVADLLVLMLTLVLPFTTPFIQYALKLPEIDWQNPGAISSNMIMVFTGLVLLMFALAAALAWFWFAMRPAVVEADLAEVTKTEATTKEEKASKKGDKKVGKGAETLATSPELSDILQAPQLDFFTWGQLMALFWTIDILFFTTFLTNVRNGLATGIVGSLGYWLAQQEVQRGSQPTYYYLFVGWIYEFFPLILTVGGSLALLYGLWFTLGWRTVAESDMPANEPLDAEQFGSTQSDESGAWRLSTPFVFFALWWAIAAFLGYTVAGEKMPWLFSHIATPICIFGGWWLGRLIHNVEWRRIAGTSSLALLLMAPALLFLTYLLYTGLPTSFDRSEASLSALMQWLVVALFWVGALYLVWRWSETSGWRSARILLGLGVLAVIFVLNVRTSFRLTYINYDYATEYLVYAHAGPDVKRALDEIDLLSARTVGERNIAVAYDDKSSWPLSWYMRLYPNAKFYGATPNDDAMKSPVIIVGPDNREKVRPYVERDYIKRTYRLVWWPDMAYFDMTWNDVWQNIIDPVKRERNWQIFFYRRYRDGDPNKFRDVAHWPSQHEFDMWVRRDIASQVWDLSVTPTTGGVSSAVRVDQQTWKDIDLGAVSLYAEPYNNQALNRPRVLSVAPNGHRLIADTESSRIVVLDNAGQFVRAFGVFCDIKQGETAGCTDPDGAGPLELGDGQFNQPWGVAADANGNLYVSDTWNGRIQVFDQNGAFLRKWGVFGMTNGQLGEANLLFGPRGLTVTPDGNLLVADTGNKRILKFSPDGQLIQQIGGGGVTPGAFDEPTAVAVDPTDGSFFVADAWNRRIQKFGVDMQFQAEWHVPGWESKEIYHKPYLVVAQNGDVYATDPQFFRVFVYNKAGGLKGAFGRFGQAMNQFALPTGLAIDPQSNLLLVADADNNRIMSLPLLP